MSRYRGPRLKIINRLRALPGLSKKKPNRSGERLVKKKHYKPINSSKYPVRLKEKQRVRFNYGLTERQLLQYVRIARRAKGSTSQVLLQLLEMRLDNIIFRLGMALTIPGARQLVNHRHILVNDRIVDIPSYRCKPQDLISIKDQQRSRNIINKNINLSQKNKMRVPFHLNLLKKKSQYVGLVKKIIDNKRISLKINELLVVEYFSRRV
uniref:Small ribosomal subunit protein uS4c n=11 Tax=Taxaceae TaxID=25623 RepID=A0A2P1AEP9_9CONI|nr:ribosomal protein S4 [Cephalotaxus harringtonia var. wilsoniana]YP_009471754.1 ribosomal protein S4 [Cephalotaxus sinensis]YP_009641684.1 ribosomal protein S4 [Cephalotaxus hainanensis]YP_010137928.1 ribosomal protein S4 [Cephalotaxus fortunei var. alpina]YP_010138010.1 ribosomal protein S4 [Cephalotaxus fortunei]YP_010138092.1 ribosomal protein S4 [Cephalotaxus griffithii]YP_010138174.1 ribosomal protein S4 [Cephalotaxus harringtonia]YP_010138256.1 ribosomal protein S4 [Cephalotaxus mann